MKSVGSGVREMLRKHEIRKAEILLAGKVKGGEEMRPLCEVWSWGVVIILVRVRVRPQIEETHSPTTTVLRVKAEILKRRQAESEKEGEKNGRSSGFRGRMWEKAEKLRF